MLDMVRVQALGSTFTGAELPVSTKAPLTLSAKDILSHTLSAEEGPSCWEPGGAVLRALVSAEEF